MPPTTPIARSKTAALSRIVDSVAKGYVHWTAGTVAAEKAVRLANKFHRLYAVGATPAQRLTRKAHKLANALLVLHWPADADVVHWLLLATAGDGLEQETLRLVTDKPRLTWLGYELVRHSARGKTSWTWRRPKDEQSGHYRMLALLTGRGNEPRLPGFLACLARQPGFHGVRSQTWALFDEARRRGYQGELPELYYVQKTSHGEKLMLDTVR